MNTRAPAPANDASPKRGGALRRTATAWHRLCAATPAGAAAYLRTLGLARRLLPRGVSRRLRNSLDSVSWPAVALPAYPTRVGRQTWIHLHPHVEEFDLGVLVAPVLEYEADLFAWLERRLDAFDVVVDVGANVGAFTTFFGARFRDLGRTDARVYAFEPSVTAFHRLLTNLAANGLDNVFAFNLALANQFGLREFFEPSHHLTNGSLVPGFAEQFSVDVQTCRVLAITGAELDELVPDGSRVLVKLDVEGAEAAALEGLTAFVARRKPHLVLEVLPGFEDAIMASAPLRTQAFRFFEIGPTGAVERRQLVAGSNRDWWLEPR